MLYPGYFLLRESMLDSVLVARDKFLKPGGALYPSHANMYMVAIQSHQSQQRLNEFHVSHSLTLFHTLAGLLHPLPRSPAPLLSHLPLPVETHQNSMEGWAEFLQDMKNFYQVDLDVLSESYRKVCFCIEVCDV